MKTIGFIVAAGNQTRFKSDTPKAVPILKKNIEVMKNYCDHIYVIASVGKESYFGDFVDESVSVYCIKSGFGCGDAVFKALNNLKSCHEEFFKGGHNLVIKWGDSLHKNADVYNEGLKALENDRDCIVVPCVHENKPYTSFEELDDGGLKVLYSKFGQVSGPGYHDLSIFFGDIKFVYDNLLKLKSTIKDGEEFLFLDVFNRVGCKGKLLKMTGVSDMSYNTVEELVRMLEK